LNAGFDFSPSKVKSSLSSLCFWLGWVNSLSPAKMEFAPARKQSAWPSFEKLILPADSLTTDPGNTILVVAIILIISQMLINPWFSNGVPGTGWSALMGTDSGCGVSWDNVRSILSRSSSFSPIPKIPPQQMVMPAFLTFSSVSNRSS